MILKAGEQERKGNGLHDCQPLEKENLYSPKLFFRMFFQNGKPWMISLWRIFTLKIRVNRSNDIQKEKFLSNLFLRTSGAMGRYSRSSYSGAMGIMSKKTEWNGIYSFLNTLKSEWKVSKGLHDLAATRSCTRVLLLRVQNIVTAGLRTWALSPEVRKSESPDPGPTGLGNRKIGKTEIAQFRVWSFNNMIVCVW